MAVNPGEEFKSVATPNGEVLRKLAYLAEQDNGSILAGGFRHSDNALDGSDKDGSKRDASSALEFLATQEELRREQMRHLTERLDALEAASRQP